MLGVDGALANEEDPAVTTTNAEVNFTAGTGLPIGNAARTIEAWINTTVGGQTQDIASYGTASGVRSEFGLELVAGDQIQVFTLNDDKVFTAPRWLADGNWHQVTTTYDGTTLAVYLDGQPLGTSTFGGALATVLSGEGLVIGRRANFGCCNFQGSVDEVAIYPTALSPTQVADHFVASGNTRPTPPGSVTAAAANHRVAVSWTASSATGSDVASYVVTAYQGTNARNAVAVSGSTTRTVVSGLAGGTAYTIKVVAVNGFGESSPSTSSAVTPTGGASTYAAEVLADSPAGYWRLGDGQQPIAADSSGNSRAAHYALPNTGATGVLVGDADTAATLGNNEIDYGFGAAPTGGLPTGNASRTLEAWFKTTVGGQTQDIASYGTGGLRGHFGVELNASNQIQVFISNDDKTFTPPGTLADGNWHQIVATYNGTTLTVYLDGVSLGTATFGGALATGVSNEGMVIGRRAGFGCCNFFGTLDEVAIYPTALSGTRVTAHYNAALAGGVPGAPTNVTAVAGPAGSVVTWAAPADDGGVPVAFYVITPYVGATPGTPVNSDGALTSAEVTALTPGTSYTFKVKAANAHFTGVDSSASSAVSASPALPAASGRVAVFVGYADTYTINHAGPYFLPSPWAGSPRVNFVGGGTLFDAGAVRIDNPTGTAITVDKVTVDIDTTTFDLWGTSLNVPAFGSLILTQTADSNFDTSEVSGEQCDTPNTIVPLIKVKIAGVTTTYRDTGQVLNTGGIDPWACVPSLNEGTPWLPVGGPPSPFERLGLRNPSENCRGCPHADPVDDLTGNFAEEFTDLAIPGRGMPIAFTRTYNSLAAGYDGYLGYGWRTSYDFSLVEEPAQGLGTITVRQENGSTVTFSPDRNGNYVAPTRVLATLVKNVDGTFTFTRRQRERYVFAANGQLIKEVDLNGYETTLSYNGSGQLVSVTDPANRTLTLTYTGSHLTGLSDPAGRTVTFGYNDAFGNLTDVTDVGGGNTHFTYDSNHLLETITNPMLGLTTNHYDSSWRVDSQTQRIELMPVRNRVTTFSYTTTQTTVTDPNGNVTVHTFEDGWPLTITRGSGSPEQAIWTYTYDPTTQAVASVKDPNNITTTYTYDERGNMLVKTVDPTGLNRATTYTYSPLNDVLTMKDGKNVTTTMTYDTQGMGNLETVSTPLVEEPGQTQTTTYTYGDLAHPGDVTQMVDPNNKNWTYGYDTYGNRTSATDPLGNKTTYCFDTVGRMTAMTTPKGAASGCSPNSYRTVYVPNAFGDVTSTTDPLGHATIREYDANRRLEKFTDGNTHFTEYIYDFVDELTRVNRADLSTTLLYAYDDAGNLLTQTDGATQATTYTYDHLNRVATMAPPKATPTSPVRTTTYTYDGAGNLKTVMDPSNRTTTFGYNAANERSSITYSDGTTPNVTGITYDPDGQRTAMTDGTGTSTYTWDSLHRMIQSKNGAGATVDYDYDLKGQITSIVYPGVGGGTVTRSFDDAGRLQTVEDWLSNSSMFDYDDNSNLIKITYPNGTTAEYLPDAADRLMSITDKTASASVFASFTYTRDNANLVKTLTPTGVTQPNETYGYSNLNQVTSVNSTGYSYDPADNLTQMSPTTLVYDQANELTSSSKPITFVSKGTVTGNMNTLTTSTFSPVAQAGDQIIVAVNEANTQTANTPTGYTLIGTFTVPATNGLERTQLFRKKATGGESSVTVTWPVSTPPHARAISAVVYRNVDPTSPLDGGPSQGVAGPTATSVTAPSITTTKATDMLLMVQSALDATPAGTWTPPPEMTNRAEASVGLASLNIGDKLLGAPGATGTQTATHTPAGSLQGLLLALRSTQTTYAYDPQGNRTTRTAPGAVVTTYGYDQANRLKTITGGTSYTYDGDGLRASKTVAGVTSPFTWNVAEGLPLLLSDGANNYLYGPGGIPLEQIPIKKITLVSQSTALDSVGNQTTLTTSPNFSPALQADDQILVAVDEARGQTASMMGAGWFSLGVTTVPTAQGNERVHVFRKKAVGGEVNVTVNFALGTPPTIHRKAVAAVVYRNVDPTTPLDGGPSTNTNGALASSVTVPGITTTQPNDQLVLIQSALDNASTATWTPPSPMVNRSAVGANLVSLAIADKSLPTAGATGDQAPTISQPASLAGVLLALRQAPIPVSYFHQDQLGSTRLLTNSAGAVAATYTFDAYGNTTAKTGTATTPLQFAGQYTDSETGFQYLRARYYDPATGQFLSRDPAVRETQVPYQYAAGSPLNYDDPTGLWCPLGKNPDGGCRGANAARAVVKVADAVADAVVTTAKTVWDNRGVVASAVAVGVCLAPAINVAGCLVANGIALAWRVEQRIDRVGFRGSLSANLSDLAVTGTLSYFGSLGAIGIGEAPQCFYKGLGFTAQQAARSVPAWAKYLVKGALGGPDVAAFAGEVQEARRR